MIQNEFNEQFDPDQFDWDGDAHYHMGLCDDDVVEAALSAALAVHENSFGWTYVRESGLRERARKLFHVKVVMPEEHREWFEKTWPEYLFVWDTATQHHDHPRSHLATELNEMEVVDQLLRRGVPYADLWGNPGRNEKYKRACITLYEKEVARDYVRYQHAESFARAFRMDWDKLVRGGYHIGGKRIHDVLLNQCLYYQSLDKIGEFCNAHALNRAHCIVHRHPESSGTLNAGEMIYAVDEKGIVTQKNVLTGEYYKHASIEALFHQFNSKTKFGGLAWTTRKLGGDAFLIEFVGCPNDICEDFVPFSYLAPATRVEEGICNVKVRKFLHFTWVTHARGGKNVLLEDTELLTELRRYQSGRLRNSQRKTELHNLARRLVNKKDIISMHGGHVHDIDVATIDDYVEAAFHMDLRHELEVAISYHRENKAMIQAFNEYMEKGKLPLNLVLPTKAVSLLVDGAAKASLATIATGKAVVAFGRAYSSSNPYNPVTGVEWVC